MSTQSIITYIAMNQEGNYGCIIFYICCFFRSCSCKRRAWIDDYVRSPVFPRFRTINRGTSPLSGANWTREGGRERTRWLDGVRNVPGKRGMTIQHAERCVQDRNTWRVYGRWMIPPLTNFIEEPEQIALSWSLLVFWRDSDAERGFGEDIVTA